MSAPVATTAGFATGLQSAKGTPASALLYHRLLSSGGEATFTEIAPQGEHYGGASPRPTLLRTVGKRSGVMIPIAEQGVLYPRALGHILRLMGWDVSTDATNAPNYYTHTFTIGDRKDQPWGTAIIDVEDDAASGDSYRFKRRIRDVRYQNLTISAGPQSIGFQASGAGLDEDTVAGTETFTTESNVFFDPAGGAFACTYGGSALFAEYSTLQVVLANPLRMNDFRMHSFGLGDLASQGRAGIGFVFGGVDLHQDIYRDAKWGGGSTGPDVDKPEVVSSVTLVSYENITGTAQPYSLSISLAKGVAMFRTPPNQGTNLLRGTVSVQMVDEDPGTEPATIVLINDVASYS